MPEPTQADQDHANAVTRAADQLNRAIESASAAGLRILIDQHELLRVGKPDTPILTVRVLKEVKGDVAAAIEAYKRQGRQG